MSPNKAIAHGQEKRRPYRGSKAFDGTCDNHGACSYCRDTRTYQARRTELAAQAERELDWREELADPWRDVGGEG